MRRLISWGGMWSGSVVTLLALMVFAGCGASTGTSAVSPPGTTTATSASAGTSASTLIRTKTANVGGKSETVLADDKGKTLYYFVPDTATTVACTGSCASNWPPLKAPPSIPTSIAGLSGTLSVVQGANGPQVAYNGHPLYTFAKDEDAEDAYGEGVAGKWHVATPSLAVQSASNSDTSGGYGG